MVTYKITNNTMSFGKRDVNYSKTLTIEYVDKLIKKTTTIKPNQSIYLVTQSLPLSVHRLRMKNFVIVDIVDSKEAEKLYKKTTNIKKNISTNVVINEKEIIDEDKTNKKKYKKKKEDDDVDVIGNEINESNVE